MSSEVQNEKDAGQSSASSASEDWLSKNRLRYLKMFAGWLGAAIVGAFATYHFTVTFSIPDTATTLHGTLTHYDKAFIFWAPYFTDDSCKYKKDPQFGEERFNERLKKLITMGNDTVEFGYSRWKVEGYWTDGKNRGAYEDGWFYEVATRDRTIESTQIIDILEDFWNQASWYITETPLQHSKRFRGFSCAADATKNK